LIRCMQRGAERFGWSARSALPGSRREGRYLTGMGMAAAIRTHFQGATRITVSVDPKGLIVVRSDMTDIGTGTYTILTQVTADALGVPHDRVRVELARSDLPVSGGSGGSYGALNCCGALKVACDRLRDQVVGPGRNVVNDFIDIALRRYPEGFQTEGTTPSMGADPRFKQFSLHTYGATFAEVRVDSVTGEVRTRRMLGVFDAGRIVNPLTARSQLMGGMLWGLSSALHDAAHVDPNHGNFVNGDLAEYLVPVHADVPDIDVLMLDEPDENANPLGIKGVGELGVCGTGAAIANAVFNATGARIREFPITVDKLLENMPG
jgi:xanthine dehydrogenase YagR molybdenum-binding subunit